MVDVARIERFDRAARIGINPFAIRHRSDHATGEHCFARYEVPAMVETRIEDCAVAKFPKQTLLGASQEHVPMATQK